MNLQQFFGRLFLKINNKKENLPLLNPTTDEFIRLTKSTNKSGSEYSLLKSNNNLNTAKKLNAALQGIDKALKEEGHNSRLLLQKSDIFIRKKKYKQARQLLHSIYKDKSNSKSSKRAQELLMLSHHLQQEDSHEKVRELIKNLHTIAKKYHHTLTKIPSLDTLSHEFDITKAVREEARLAIRKELPVLSYELINQALSAKLESPWLLLCKALSLDMMGQHSEAIKIIEKLHKSNKGEKITRAIDQALNEINQRNKQQNQFNFNIYLSKHLACLSEGQGIEFKYVPKSRTIGRNTKVKALIFKESLELFQNNPQHTLLLLNCILDFAPNDGASLQLKAEALDALKRSNEAIQIWKFLAESDNEKISSKACASITDSLSRTAKRISINQSPEIAIRFFIQQHLRLKIVPSLNEIIENIISQATPQKSDLIDPELRQHELQLHFNTSVVECLEEKLREQGSLGSSEKPQSQAAIGNSAPKAG